MFTLREDSEKPILFVAGSTGFAPVKSMVESAFHTGMRRKMVLYWGTPPSDLYLAELLSWARANTTILNSFRCCPIHSRMMAGLEEPGWCIRQFYGTILTCQSTKSMHADRCKW